MALALACSTTGIILYLSPIPLIRSIQHTKTTGTYSVLPLAATALNGMVWAWYGILTSQLYPMFVVNFIGAILSIIYICIFCRHASSLRQTTITIVALFMGAAFVLFTYLLPTSTSSSTHIQDSLAMNQELTPVTATTALPSPLTQRVGSFGVLVGICMFAAPFATIREVISKQSADSLPLPIISVNLINAVLWSAYGFQLNDGFIIGPNALGFVCASLQLALHQRYSNYCCRRYFDSKNVTKSLKKMQHDIINPFKNKETTTIKREIKKDLEVEVVKNSGGDGGGNSFRSTSRGGSLFSGSGGSGGSGRGGGNMLFV